MKQARDPFDSFDPATQALLDAYGFDRALFDKLCGALRSGELSVERNRVAGMLSAPSASQLRALPEPGTPEHAQLCARGAEALRAGQVGCVVLAGGMATRFGGVVKAAVDALPGKSFLSLKLADVRRAALDHDARVPLFIMSSFATHAQLQALIDTAPALRGGASGVGKDHDPAVPVEVFPQLISLRVTPEGELWRDKDGKPSPYAPGHGDLSFALRRSGVLARFLAGGGRVLTMTNVDNLGATLDPAVIGAHLEAGTEMTVEVGRRTPGEAGGTPLLLDGKLQIIEDFRLPAGFDLAPVPYFNTNTFVFDARALDREVDLTWFVVRKKVEGRDAIQFEHLVGELSAYLSCAALEVARDGLQGRFQPAKDPEELERRRPEIERILRARRVL